MTDASQLEYLADLIEHQGKTLGDKTYILHEDQKISFADYDRFTCRAANGLLDAGAKPGDGTAIFMGNCLEYLYLFYGLPRAGMYTVPVNVALKKDGLRFILENSDVKFLVVDEDLYPNVADLGSSIGAIEKIFVRSTSGAPVPEGTIDLATLWQASPDKPDHQLDPESLTYLMYTSGTTGFPKGVVNRNRTANIPGFIMLSSLLYQDEDVLYTALPLFHANALILTAGFAMARGLPFALEKRFSASGFWDSIRKYGGTSFNGLGAMVPILMKQPEKPDDADNPIRLAVTAACPASLWEDFEKRFGLKIWEAYGAVDGGGTLIFNFGNAPVGSVGAPFPDTVWKLADDDGNEVARGELGELVVKEKEGVKNSVEYYKNPEASKNKVRDGWIYSGDLFYADKDGNLYFVDRKSDCMRRRGENISSWEVENVVEKHPDVAECAAFGVPSELGEDEVMIWIKSQPGATINMENLMRHCADNMAHFMVPRFVEVVDHIPRTETLRVIKTDMKKQGVTEATWDREKEMPDLKLK